MNDTKNQGTPAVGFLIMAFTEEKAGDEALKAMQAARQQKRFYFENAAVIRQDTTGKVHYRETGDMKTGKGAGVGALIGGVIGIFGGPAGVALGASTGGAIGAAAAHKDAGFRDESLKTVGQAMKPGTSAVAAITNVAFLRDLQKQTDVEAIRAFVDKLAAEISAKLNEGKNVALGILLSESGLVFKEVAANENSAEVISLAITDEAVVAGAALATADRLDYGVMAATSDAVMTETGTVTKEGAVIVDDVVTREGESVVVTAVVPEEAVVKAVEAPKPAAAGVRETSPTEPAPKPAAKKSAPAKKAVSKKPAKPAPKKAAKKSAPVKKTAKPAPKKTAKKSAPAKKTAKPAPKKPAKKTAPAKKSSRKSAKPKPKKPVKKAAPAKKSTKKS
jgi:uncharacterized membrane protein